MKALDKTLLDCSTACVIVSTIGYDDQPLPADTIRLRVYDYVDRLHSAVVLLSQDDLLELAAELTRYVEELTQPE